MVLLTVADEVWRDGLEHAPVPEFETTAFNPAPPLAEARVAIVTTAGLRTSDQEAFGHGDQSFRVLPDAERNLHLAHVSSNFDRSGLIADLNVVYPVDRLHELAEQGVIGSVAARHLAFMGAQDETMTTIRMDTGPAAAKVLRDDGVDVVLLTPI